MKTTISLLTPLLLLLFSACSDITVETTENFELVELPDNSYVFLNKNSAITYPGDFSSRELELKGEAFFDVTKGDEPFTVKTALGEVTVLGTEFSVKSTGEQMKVQVKKGAVEVKAKDMKEKLKRGQQALMTKVSKQWKKSKADLDYELWLSEMHIELKKLGKEVDRGAKLIQKETKKLEKDLIKEVNKLKKSLN